MKAIDGPCWISEPGFGVESAGSPLIPAAKPTVHLRQRFGLETAGFGGRESEFRIQTGPGYRIFFGREGETVIVLLGGDTMSRQQTDIAAAKANSHDYVNLERGI